MIGINLFNAGKNELPSAEASFIPDFLPQDAQQVLQSFQHQYPGVDISLFRPYIHYPLHTRVVNGSLVLLEGYVHGMRIAEALDELANWVGAGECAAKGIQQKLRKWSGDYFIFIITGSQCWFFNDYFGRLSLYWHYGEDYFFIGRSLQHLFAKRKRIADKMAVAQAIWCGYPINSNTFYKGVKKLTGNTALVYNLPSKKLELLPGEVLNFDEQYAQDSKTAAAELATLYVEGCRKIAHSVSPLPVNVSLSGGQDSRMVAWGFAASYQDVQASSFRNSDAVKDVAIAKTIAGICNIPLHVIDLQQHKDDEARLLQWKQGMNYVGMSFIMDFYDQLQAVFPTGSLYVTGDAADVTLRYLGEPDRDLSLDELVERHVKRYMICPLSIAETITNVSAIDLKQSIYDVLNNYPEKDPNNKSYHYYIFERFSQYYFEGEDRSKCFFWATNPFFDLEFFHRGRVVPQEYKKAYRFFRQFMHALHYPLSEVPDANGYSINSRQYRLRRWVQEQFRSADPALKKWLHAMYTGNTAKDRAGIDQWQHGLTSLLEEDSRLQWMNTEGFKTVLSNADMKQTQFLRNILKALTLNS